MRLNELKNKPGARRPRKRVGRGIGSGTGKTAGRGEKGQKSRSGVALSVFEGGQMPIHRRLPKRGFNNKRFAKRYVPLNLGRLQEAIDAGKLDAGKPITEDVLLETGVVTHRRDGVRLLGKGELKAKVDLTLSGASKSAAAAVEKAGGKIVLTAPANEKAESGAKKDKAEDAGEAADSDKSGNGE